MLNTTLCYIEKNNFYLMLHRIKKKNDINHDKWIGIGGKFEERESPEDCVLREVYEETGLTLVSWRYCGIITFICDEYETEFMHLYSSDSFSGELRECDEGVLQWVPIERIVDLPIWAGDKIFLKLMQQKQEFFSLKVMYQGNTLVHAILNGKENLV
jgi:8-oxo-dGTP diphosphatase